MTSDSDRCDRSLLVGAATIQMELEDVEKAWGPDHPDVARILNKLARQLCSEGHYPQAEPIYRRWLNLQVKLLGPDSPSRA